MSLEAKQKDAEHIEKTVVRDTEKAGGGDDGTEEAVDPGLESRFLEVKSAAVEEDDITMIAETFRAYAIGILLCGAAAAISDLADWREEPMVIDSSLVQLVALPIGKGWARYMPKWKIGTQKYFFNLNPGPFTIKEHTLIVAMANVATGYPPYALGLLISQITKYNQNFGFMYSLTLLIGTEMIGFSLAGLCRRFLLYPGDMIWPVSLQTAAFLNTMHRDKNVPVGRWTISRYKLFYIALVAMFMYSFIPGFVPFFSRIDFITPSFPDNKIVNILFGTRVGLGLLPLTLSWQTLVTFLGPPQVVPASGHANILAGLILWFWITAGIMYAKNYWDSQYFPIGSPGIYTNKATPYDIKRILNPDATLNLEQYKDYSPLLQSPRLALAYALSFASISSVLVHCALYEGKDVMKRLFFKFGDAKDDDIHTRQMRKYPEVPEWWYMATLAITFGISMASVVAWPTHLPWWGFIITLLIPITFILPIGIIQARSSYQIGLNVITEFLAGYIWPGRPVANTLVKIYGYMAMYKGLLFVMDLKLGAYMKVPPKAMFRFQMLGAFMANLVSLGVFHGLLNSVPNFCEPDNKQGFTCIGQNVFFRATVIWGLVGPGRIFSPDAFYGASLWFFLLGALAPLIFFLLHKVWPKSWLKHVNIPLIFGGTGMIPPATPLNHVTWGVTGLFLNGWVMSRYPAWWAKYNYILGVALGMACTFQEMVFSVLGVFGVELDFRNKNALMRWATRGLDARNRGAGLVLRTVGEGQTIGPKTWS